MAGAVRQAVGGDVAAEDEVGGTPSLDRPAAIARRQIKQRTRLRAHHIVGNGLRCEQRLELEALGENVRSPHRPAARTRSRRSYAAALRQAEAADLADHRVA